MSDKKNKKDMNDSELFIFDKTADLSVRYIRESYNAAKSRAAELSTNGALALNLRGYSQQAVRIYSALATLLYATISISKADDLERFIKKRSFQVPNNLFDFEEWGPVLKIARTVRIGEMAKYQDEMTLYKNRISTDICQVYRLAKALVSAMRTMKSETSNELHLLRTELQSLRSSVIPLVQGKLIDLEQRNASLRRENEFKDQTIARVTESEHMAKRAHLSELELFERKQSQEMQTIKLKHEADILAIEKKHRAELDDLVGQHRRALEESETRRQNTEAALRAQLSALDQSKTEEYEHMDNEHKMARLQLETDTRHKEKQYQDTIAMNKTSLELAAEKLRKQDDRMKTAEMDIDHLKQDLESLRTENNSDKARCADFQEQVIALKHELTNTKEKLDLKCKELRDIALANEEEICQKEGQFGSLLSKLFEAERVHSEMKKANEKKIQALEANVVAMRNSLREMERQKENELCAKESSFGSLLSKLFEAERLMGVMKKEHDAEKKALERRLSAVVHDESSNSQYIRDKYAGLKVRVIENDVQVVASFFAEWCVNDSVARVCAYQDAQAAPVENHSMANSMSFIVDNDAEKFDDVAFCKFVTENITSESIQKAINETVQLLNAKVTELTAEGSTLRSEDSSLRDELRICMGQLHTSLDDVDSLKRENAKVSTALRDCQEKLGTAEAKCVDADQRYKEMSKRNVEVQRSYESISKEVEQCQRYLSDSNGLLEVMRTRESQLAHDLEIANAAVQEKGSYIEIALCENIATRVVAESLHNVIENRLISKLHAAEETISDLKKEILALKETALSGTINPMNQTMETCEREQELLHEIATCRKEIATKESELAAMNTRLHERECELENNATEARKSFAAREAELSAEVATVLGELKVKDKALGDIALKASENLHLTQQAEKRVIRLQAVARGFIARSSTRRMRITQAAKSSGVLVALRHTVQGETGWYCGPDGSLYYFVLDQGEWLLTCGPISREQLDTAVNVPGGVSLQTKKNPNQRYLKYCDFELVAKAIDFQGEVFISPQTWKLFFAISVESLMIDSK